MKNFCRKFVIFAALTMLLYACNEKATLKVGFLGGLTGRAADLCISARNGAQLAIEKVNAGGGIDGRQVELLVFDNQDQEDKARQGVEFLAEAKVTAIIGPLTSQMSAAATPTANQRKTVLISPTTSTLGLSGLDDYFFRVYPTCDSNARALAEYAVRTANNKRIAILSDHANASFTIPWEDSFSVQVRETGSEISTIVTFNSHEKNFSFIDLARQIIATEPDGILILTNSIDAALFSQQVRKLVAGVDLYGSDWAFSGELIQYGGSSVEGFTFTTNVDMENDSPAFRTFKSDFQKRFNKAPNFPAVLAYEATQLLFEALRLDDDPQGLKETLRKVGEVKGLQNNFQLDSFGDVKRPSYLNQVKEGHFVIL